MSENARSADNQQGSPNINWDPSETTRQAPIIKAYILGALHDGTFSCNKRFRISQKGTTWLIFLRKLLKNIGFNSWIYREGRDRDVYVLESIASFLKLDFDPSVLRSTEEIKAYIRGFFDAEGGIPNYFPSRFYIQLVQKDKIKLKKIKIMLEKFGITTGKIHNPSVKVDPNYWRMYVLSNSQERFVKEIGTWHPRKRKILGNRMMI